MAVLITGGCGFIGSNLVRHLTSQGEDCLVLDDLSVGSPVYLQGQRYRLVEGSILDSELLDKLVKNVRAVIHLAAKTSVIDSIRNPAEDHRVNVFGTLNVLESCRRSGGRRFIFASSSAPLGDQLPPLDESKVPHPVSPYGASKLAGEGYCSAYFGAYGVETVALRFSNVYGPFSTHKTSVVAQFIHDAKSKGFLTVYGDGTQTRDFLYVGDLCRAIQAALITDEIGGECFQIGTGRETEVLELIGVLERHFTPPPRVEFVPARRGEIKRNYVNIAKATQRLGYRPQISLESGIRETLTWFKESGRA